MKKIRNKILLLLYNQSKELTLIHSWSQLILINFFIPVFIFIFKIINHKRITTIIPRHSILENNAFNIFMSDIDITIVCYRDQDIQIALESFYKFKALIPIIGEPEICTQVEWKDRNAFKSIETELVWSNIFNLRKISWQELKLLNAKDDYEKVKTQRGIKKSKQKLNAKNNTISLNSIFPFDIQSQAMINLNSPHHSNYLECLITHLIEEERNLFFDDHKKMEGFFQILPGNLCQDQDIKGSPMRIFIIKSEILLSKYKMRILTYKGTEDKEIVNLQSWIKSLEESL